MFRTDTNLRGVAGSACPWRAARGFLATLVMAGVATGAAVPSDLHERVRWQGTTRTVAVHLPAAGAAGAPLLLVLGEPGRSARYAMDSWRGLADRQGFVVAALSSQRPDRWLSPQDGPGLLRVVVQHLETRHGIDPRRVFLFGSGYSAGFALTVGALQPQYFAAVAGFDGVPQPEVLRGEPMPRSLPMRIFHSKRRLKVDIDAMQAAAAALREVGAEVTVQALDADADFVRKGHKVAAKIWDELSPHALAEAPRYRRTPYGD